VQLAKKELVALEEVIQPHLAQSKAMVEGLVELTKHLDEFKTRDNEQHSQVKEVRLCFVDATSSGVKVVALDDTGETNNFTSE